MRKVFNTSNNIGMSSSTRIHDRIGASVLQWSRVTQARLVQKLVVWANVNRYVRHGGAVYYLSKGEPFDVQSSTWKTVKSLFLTH